MAETQFKPKETKEKEARKEAKEAKEAWNLSREKILAILCAKQEVETNALAFITPEITRKVESKFI